MGYERYPRGTQPGDYYNRDQQDYGSDYSRSGSYSSARDYAAAGEMGDQARERGWNDRGGYGRSGGAGFDRDGRGDSGRGSYGARDSYGSRDDRSAEYGAGSFGGRDTAGREWRGYGSGRGDEERSWSGGGSGYRPSFDRSQSYGGYDRGGERNWRGDRGGRDYGRQPQGYNYEDRGFFQRAGDEVRSWFGDEDAEQRRDQDARYDEQQYGGRSYGRDDDYHQWRRGQINALDRDYDEYRRENSSKWASEFGSWRSNRQTQRDSLTKVKEHMEVVGSDGKHVGTVDHVRGDRILLTKTDKDAGGHHHSIPSSWITTVADKVTIARTADEAQRSWKDEEQNQAMFGQDRDRDQAGSDRSTNLNRSFSGTY